MSIGGLSEVDPQIWRIFMPNLRRFPTPNPPVFIPNGVALHRAGNQ
jgi:hypothetical protein